MGCLEQLDMRTIQHAGALPRLWLGNALVCRAVDDHMLATASMWQPQAG